MPRDHAQSLARGRRGACRALLPVPVGDRAPAPAPAPAPAHLDRRPEPGILHLRHRPRAPAAQHRVPRSGGQGDREGRPLPPHAEGSGQDGGGQRPRPPPHRLRGRDGRRGARGAPPRDQDAPHVAPPALRERERARRCGQLGPRRARALARGSVGAPDHRRPRALHPADPGAGGRGRRPAAHEHELRQHDSPGGHAVAAPVRPRGVARVHLQVDRACTLDLEEKVMTEHARDELAIPAHGLVQRTRDALLELISRVPESSEDRAVDAAMRARELTTAAALKAATISGSLALPPGPLGLVTVLPDLYAVWRVQARLVSDIAAVYGQAFLSQESMAWCLFRHAAAQAVRDVVTRIGERVVVNRTSLRALETILTRLGVVTTQRLLEKGAARFIPMVGALGVAAYAYYDTGQVGHTAIDLFGREITTADVP